MGKKILLSNSFFARIDECHSRVVPFLLKIWTDTIIGGPNCEKWWKRYREARPKEYEKSYVIVVKEGGAFKPPPQPPKKNKKKEEGGAGISHFFTLYRVYFLFCHSFGECWRC